jgi:adenylate kinase
VNAAGPSRTLGVVFVGPPASGKGTQVQMLQERAGACRLDTGAMLRRAASAGTPVGLLVKGYMDRGALVPDEVLTPLVREALSGPEFARGFILDGYPRTVAQAEMLEKMLSEMGLGLNAVLAFELPEETLIRRRAGRLICRACGRVYNRYTLPPEVEGRCACGGELYQRSDDSEETMRARLHVYRTSTAPLFDFYLARGLLKVIAATGSPDEVHGRVLKALDLVQ